MIKILFVDDEPAILSGLRRMLYIKRDIWSMNFVNNGNEALAELERDGDYNVVVSDMRMPGMDGADLLGHVRDRFPDTVRIILSGQSDASAAIRSIAVAHQFLGKPCDPVTLQQAVGRSLELQQRLSDPSLRKMLGHIDVLPSPPVVVARLNQAIGDPNASIDDVAEIIESDPALTAKLLQVVNSAFFGLAHGVSDIRNAVSYLGLATVRNLLAAVELVRSLPASSKVPVSMVNVLHDHATAVATVARKVVSDERLHGNDAYTAGMVHDLGLLALASYLPDQFLALHEVARSKGVSIVEVEGEILGTSHADLGAYLLSLWGLPYLLVEAVARHHETPVNSATTVIGPTEAVQIAEASCPY